MDEIVLQGDTPPPPEVAHAIRQVARTSVQEWFPQYPQDQIELALNWAEKRCRQISANPDAATVASAAVDFFTSGLIPVIEITDPNHNGTEVPQNLTREEIYKQVMELNPRVDPDWVREKCASKWSLQRFVDFMFDPANSVPKKRKPSKRYPESEEGPSSKSPKAPGYLDEWWNQPAHSYQDKALIEEQILYDFKQFRKEDLKKALRFFNSRYAPTFKALTEDVATNLLTEDRNCIVASSTMWKNQMNGYRAPASLRVMRTKRNKPGPILSETLQKEVDWIKNEMAPKGVEIEVAAGEGQEMPNGEGIECEVCMTDVSFDNCIGCRDSHFFCKECVQSAAQEAVFGLGKSKLDCLAVGCGSGFDREDLVRAVKKKVLDKMDERAAESDIQLAGLDHIERCKYCGWAMEIEATVEEVKVFRCAQCEAEVCRKCNLDWDEDHMGVPCEQMESDTKTKARVEYENKMTAAIVRMCHRCHNPMIKSTGCNKMTCQCGAKLCYVCREPIKDYSHFCQHPLTPPAKTCGKCTKCNLWDSGADRDQKALDEIETQAKADQRMHVKNMEEQRNVPNDDDTQPGPSNGNPQDEAGPSNGGGLPDEVDARPGVIEIGWPYHGAGLAFNQHSAVNHFQPHIPQPTNFPWTPPFFQNTNQAFTSPSLSTGPRLGLSLPLYNRLPTPIPFPPPPPSPYLNMFAGPSGYLNDGGNFGGNMQILPDQQNANSRKDEDFDINGFINTYLG